MKMAQNKRIIQGLGRMVWWWKGGLLVKVEKLPGKHLVIAIVKKKKKALLYGRQFHDTQYSHSILNSSRQGRSTPRSIPQTEDLPGSPSVSFPSWAAWDVLYSFSFFIQ